MSNLKISEAAIKGSEKEIQSFFVVREHYNPHEELRTEEKRGYHTQLTINSELDRIAGPLVEALELVRQEHLRCWQEVGETGHSEFNYTANMANLVNQALANYRKERGE